MYKHAVLKSLWNYTNPRPSCLDHNLIDVAMLLTFRQNTVNITYCSFKILIPRAHHNNNNIQGKYDIYHLQTYQEFI